MLILTALIGVLTPGAFFFAYLTAAVLWLGLPLGCGAILMLHHLVGGRWGLMLRPILARVTITLPLLAVLFCPLLLGLHRLYPWASAETRVNMAAPKLLYLNVPFFLLRTLGYFVLWCLGAWLLWRLSRRDEADAGKPVRYAPRLGALGLILYVLTVSFAGIDWVGSLEPVWHSSIFGLYILIGQSVLALALIVVVKGAFAGGHEPEAQRSADLRNDVGNLLLAFVVLHAYFAFSQFLIIWNGNLPVEIGWYVTRTRGGWLTVVLGIVFLHFALPFVILLSRNAKRSAKALIAVAGLLLVARWIDYVWMVLPSYNGSIIVVLFLTMTATLGLGGVWYWCFTWTGPRPRAAAAAA